jgi:hypothetical protein
MKKARHPGNLRRRHVDVPHPSYYKSGITTSRGWLPVMAYILSIVDPTGARKKGSPDHSRRGGLARATGFARKR